MAMLFSIVEYIKEQLVIIIKDRIESKLAKEQEELEKNEMLTQQLKKGTPVTPETFEAWKKEMFKEIILLNKRGETLSPALETMAIVYKLIKDPNTSTKLSGRQLFEKDTSLATADMKLLDENDVAVDFTLFEGLEEEGFSEDDEGDTCVLAHLTED
jgi:hypothetical protein